MSEIKVITSVQRRRRWRPEEKRAMVEEAEQPGMSISAVDSMMRLFLNTQKDIKRLNFFYLMGVQIGLVLKVLVFFLSMFSVRHQ